MDHPVFRLVFTGIFTAVIIPVKTCRSRKTGLYGMFSAAALTILLLAITYAAHYREERNSMPSSCSRVLS